MHESQARQTPDIFFLRSPHPSFAVGKLLCHNTKKKKKKTIMNNNNNLSHSPHQTRITVELTKK